MESAGNELAARGEELLEQQQLLEEKIAAFMADAEAQIAAADAQFAEQGVALENGRLELASAFSQLEDGQAQINNGWSELESQRVSGEQALAEAWQEIQQGEADLSGRLGHFHSRTRRCRNRDSRWGTSGRRSEASLGRSD
ncbi:MAG: hypothetical protein V9E84_08230 [Trichococcus flocculiformis]